PYSESDLRAEEDRGALRAALGVNAWYHQNDGRTAANDDAWSVGVDLAAMWHGFTLSGEYHYRETDPAGAAPFDMELDGWFAQAGYMIVPQTFEIAFRYAEVDWSNVVASAGQTAAREYLIVLGYFWNDHSLKAQLDFGRVENRFFSGNAEDEYRLRLQFQIIF
ncbi:MAG TPA: hypothetical protein VEI02_07235, partial [Planctomycetota bacterium]|nr:hypothetical protein [Planctomycetota bacterium]